MTKTDVPVVWCTRTLVRLNSAQCVRRGRAQFGASICRRVHAEQALGPAEEQDCSRVVPLQAVMIMLLFGLAAQGWMMGAVTAIHCLGLGLLNPAVQGLMSRSVPAN